MGQTLAWLVLATTLAAERAAPGKPQSPFQERGYYITFMRMPTFDLADWKRIVDGIQDDDGNLLLLWMGGAFRSEKFPITWKYNEEHHNVRQDFVRDLIDHAHTKGIRVLLGFTPFGYDGVNHYPLEHPELRATGQGGKPVGKFGIGCWGYNLCPSKPESQRFMLEYVREMVFDFYPNADGLMIESSDYAICHCPDCGERFFEQEFRFVRQISEEVWAKKPEAMVVAYREFTRNPDLTFEQFKERLGREVFGDATTRQIVEDLLELQATFATERTWCQPSPVMCPERVRAMKAQGRLTPEKRDQYSAALRTLADIQQRNQDAPGEGQQQLREITQWVLGQWTEENRALLK